MKIEKKRKIKCFTNLILYCVNFKLVININSELGKVSKCFIHLKPTR